MGRLKGSRNKSKVKSEDKKEIVIEKEEVAPEEKSGGIREGKTPKFGREA